MNKKKLSALSVMPVLSLLTAATLADVSGQPLPSGDGVTPTVGEQIKNAKACGNATFFKNVFPSLTNGSPGGSTSIDFLVEGKTVSMTVTWDDDNSFDFVIDGGWASKVGVTVDTNHFLYEYSSPAVGVSDPSVGFTDTQLNYYGSGFFADDVNHLDICLDTLDSDAPDVGIRVEPSSDGKTVVGTVSIIATIIDDSSVNAEDVGIQITSLDGSITVSVCDLILDPSCTELLPPTISPDGSVFTWIWDTSQVLAGEYIITVGATDASVLRNEATKTLNVDVLTSAQNCLEGGDFVPDNAIGEGGCNPTGFQNIELPNAFDGLLDGKFIINVAAPATNFSGVCNAEFVAQDPRVDEAGNVLVNDSLDLSTVFDLSGFFPPGTDPADLVGKVVLRANTVGSPCLVLIFGDANFSFAEFYDPNNGAPLQNSGAYTYAVTQFPESVPGMFTIPEVGDLTVQPDLQYVPQATYQPDDRSLLIENEASPFTSDVINPQRKLTPTFSWFLLNTREVCLSLDLTDGTPYLEAVLQCKIDLALEYFDNLELALIESEANLIVPSLNNLLTDVNKARSMVKVGYWDKATVDLSSLLNQVVGGQWIVDEGNDPGMLVMRIKNLLFRIEQLALADGALP